MAGVTGRVVGFRAELYKLPLQTGTSTAATIATASTSATLIKDIRDIGGIAKERNIIDVPVYGQDSTDQIPGQINSNTFDFSVTLNLDNTLHKSIRDDDATQMATFVMKISKGNQATYCVFNGFVGNATITPPIDDVVAMEVTVARVGTARWLDAAQIMNLSDNKRFGGRVIPILDDIYMVSMPYNKFMKEMKIFENLGKANADAGLEITKLFKKVLRDSDGKKIKDLEQCKDVGDIISFDYMTAIIQALTNSFNPDSKKFQETGDKA